MRLFIAICLSDPVKDAVGRVINDMKRSGARGKYTVPENMHLTLAFIGETDRIRDIEEALDDVEFEPFELALSGFGHFGNLYWVGLDRQPALTLLAREIRKALDDYGIPFDRKPFKAHITAARRVESHQPIRVRIPDASMQVTAFSLMRSQRVKNRMVYTEMERWEAKDLSPGEWL